MPHDVIMPALGMAQDTGLIVSWLKKAGDQVKTGDALMEVETDKATMEVEAQADGFLTHIQAGEGDNVPVGDVVARISETVEANSSGGTGSADPTIASAQPDAAQTEVSAQDIEGQKVIMPALGMAQDTGLIIAWRKQPGDKVSTDDVLFEVETDKSTMEVTAGHDGYVAGIFAEAGDNVPVGDVIAIIFAEKPSAPVAISTRSNPASALAKDTAAGKQACPEAKAPARAMSPRRSGAATSLPSGRILASPKAKHLAKVHGLDLGRLVREGVPQPFHVADLETLKGLSQDVAVSHGIQISASRHAVAQVSTEKFDSFMDWMGGELEQSVGCDAVYATFGAAAYREMALNHDITVAVETRGRNHRYQNPDQSGIGNTKPDTDDAAPGLKIRDFAETPVTAVQLGAEQVPTLTITRAGEVLTITFECGSDVLSADAALALISGFAERVSEPLRHLL